jgi:hypothetical protein
MKLPEPAKAIFQDPADASVWHWTYTLPGPGDIPIHDDAGYAASSAEAVAALNAARTEGSLKWQAHVRALSPRTDRQRASLQQVRPTNIEHGFARSLLLGNSRGRQRAQ